MKFPPWHQRPDEFDPETHREGILDSQSFLRVADQFISLANQRNKKIESTELQMVMLYAAARYASHVGKNVLNVEEQEDFVQHMVAQYTDMLRENMALSIRRFRKGFIYFAFVWSADHCRSYIRWRLYGCASQSLYRC